jgi:hypothetical protein
MANTSDILGGQTPWAIPHALWLCLAAHPCRAKTSLQAATRGGVRLTPSDLPPDRVELRWRQRLDSLQRALRQLLAYEGIDFAPALLKLARDLEDRP